MSYWLYDQGDIFILPIDCLIDLPFLDGGLVGLFGGKKQLLAKLHQLLTVPSTFRVGSYGEEIHEMTEMRALAMGQYGHNNQPCHHLLYLFALLGEPSTTYSAVRMVLERAYGRDFYAGDEDNGEQGAWYVLSSLGLYSTTPGTTEVRSIFITIIIILIIIIIISIIIILIIIIIISIIGPSDSCSLTVAIAFVSDRWCIDGL